MKIYKKSPSQPNSFINKSKASQLPLKWSESFISYIIILPFRLLLLVANIAWQALNFPLKLLPHRLIHRLNPIQRLFLNVVTASIFLIFGIWIYTSFSQPEQSEAVWFNDQWLYRQKVDITNSSGSNLTDFQVAITLNTAQMITDGKLQSDCDDIRFVNQKGDILHHWRIPTTLCNTSTTKFFVRITSIPTNGTTIFVYYGNSTAQNIEDAGKVFDRGGIRGFFYAHNSGSHPTTSAAFDTFFTSNIAGFQGQQLYSQINCANNNCNPFDPDDDNYATYFEGIIYIPTTGTYYFATDSDDASDIYIDGDFTASSSAGTNVANWYNGHGLANNWSHNGSIVLTKGYHTFRYRMEEVSGGDGFRAAWQKPGDTSYSYITGEYFYSKKYASSEPTISLGTEEQSPGPVAYWKFDEGTGTTAYDSSTNKYHGIISGATWKQEGECLIGKCLYFDGVNDYIDLGSSSRYGATKTTGAYTIEAWVKPVDVARYNILTLRIGGFHYFSTGITGGEAGGMRTMVHDAVSNANYWPTSNLGILKANQWNHVVFIFEDGVGYKYYLNGKLDKEVANSNLQFYNYGGNAYIGYGTDSTTFFKGFIDEVKVYPYVRTPEQIRADFGSIKGSIKGTSVGIGGSSLTSSLSNGLVGYWKMDETTWSGTAGEVIDSSGNENNGTAVSGAEASPSAKFGRSGYFAGIDENVAINNSPSISNFSNGVTVSLWFKTNSVSSAQSQFGYNGGGFLNFWMNSGVSSTNLRWETNSGQSITSTTAIYPNTWYHAVGVYDTKTGIASLYINGRIDVSANRTFNTSKSGIVTIGSYSTSQYFFNGNIDEVRIYNRALSPAEVQELYNFAPGPIAYYDFEEGQGTSLNDKSGNGNNSTSFGGTPTWTKGFYGKGMKFDNASTDQVTIPGSEILNYNNYTLGFWINFTDEYDGSYRQIIARDPNGSDRSPGIWRYPNMLRIHWKHPYPGNAGPVAIGPNGENTSFVANKWYYMTGVKNGTSFDYYLNGVKIGSTYTLTDPMINDAGGSFYIGKSAGYNSAGFIIDEIKLYNYARTQKQIIEDMNAGHPIGGSPVGSQALYLKFDEGYGTTAYDSGPNRINGTITSCSWTLAGKFNKGINCNGGGYVTLGSNTAFDSSSFTYTFWIKTGVLGADQYSNIILGRENYTVSGFRAGLDNSGRVYFWTTQSGGTLSLTSNRSVTGDWHYVAVTYDSTSSTGTIYIDGKKDVTATGTYIVPTGVSLVLNGGIGGTTRSNSLFDEFKFYSSALSPSEIQNDYNRGASLVMGATSTSDDGTTASSSASRAYCIPGDTSVPAIHLVGEWKFEEGSGGTVNDTSGNGNTGTWNGTGTLHWTKGKIGKAGNFDGSSDYVSVNSSATIPTGGTARTLEMWVYTTDNSWADNANTIFEYGTNTTRQAFGIDMNPFPNIEVYTWADDATVNTGLSNKAGWWHLAVTYDGSTTIKTYINGVLKSTKTLAGVLNTASSTVNIGRSALVNAYFDGRLDHIQLYDYARTPSQITWDYNRGKPVLHTGNLTSAKDQLSMIHQATAILGR
ncbi:MAG: hypothetical protein KatS3mg089_0924 [Patescibacteria group bacterium]|nr:MAG: hypothetical protein KatS3mg089_0924 [Patescibacteria group bacterium]